MQPQQQCTYRKKDEFLQLHVHGGALCHFFNCWYRRSSTLHSFRSVMPCWICTCVFVCPTQYDPITTTDQNFSSSTPRSRPMLQHGMGIYSSGTVYASTSGDSNPSMYGTNPTSYGCERVPHLWYVHRGHYFFFLHRCDYIGPTVTTFPICTHV